MSARRYRPLGKEPDAIFARGEAAEEEARAEAAERIAREEEEISSLAALPVFRSWLSRVFRANGGMMNSCLKTDAGQAQGMTLYLIARDLSRTEAGRGLVMEIVSEHFGTAGKGKGR